VGEDRSQSTLFPERGDNYVPGSAGPGAVQYIDENGERKNETSADVNAYLREITRTQRHCEVLPQLGQAPFWPRWRCRSSSPSTRGQVKTNVRAAIERVAARLGNTPPICGQYQRRAPLAAPPLDRFGPARSSRIEPWAARDHP
jgi:DNA topoisomerase IB